MSTLLSVIEEPCYALGLASIVKAHADGAMEVLENVSTLARAAEQVVALRPKVVVLDTTIRCSEEALRGFLGDAAKSTSVLALGVSRTKATVQQLFASGIKGYLLKNADAAEFMKAIAAVAKGEGYLDASLVTLLMRGEPSRDLRLMTAPGPTARISEREIAVLKRTAFGYSAKEIARALDISQKSVETYKARATAKLGLDTRSDIIRYANSSGWFAAFADESAA